jgi:hypothetical protein
MELPLLLIGLQLRQRADENAHKNSNWAAVLPAIGNRFYRKGRRGKRLEDEPL